VDVVEMKGLRLKSENDVLATTARISQSSAAHVATAPPAVAPQHQRAVGGAPDWTGCAIPKAHGKYPKLYPLVALCKDAGLQLPVPEYEFHPTRKWQFDYAFPLLKIAVEIEGGIWRQGGGAHSHPLNIERDIEKYNAAAILGWRVLRYAPEDIGNAINDLRRIA
jgi:hypothetical protein